MAGGEAPRDARRGAWRVSTVVLLALVALGARVGRADPSLAELMGTDLDLDGERVRFTLPEIPGLKVGRNDGGVDRHWRVSTQRLSLQILVRHYPLVELAATDPSDVVAHEVLGLLDPFWDHRIDEITTRDYVRGGKSGIALGYLIAGHTTHSEWGPGEIMLLGFLLKKSSVTVLITLCGEDRARAHDAILQFARTGVRADVIAHDPGWTAPDIGALLDRVIPSDVGHAGFRTAFRSKHYIVLSNGKVPASAGSDLEAAYEDVRRLYPFEETPGRSLLPIVLFRDQEEYRRLPHAVRKGERGVVHTSGYARADCVVSFLQENLRSVLRHEAAHQLFANRIFLPGGGSWLQEGLAEYVSTTPSERRTKAKEAGLAARFIPFEDLVAARELVGGVSDVDGHVAYLEAASLVEFLRDADPERAKFLDFVKYVGGLRWDLHADQVGSFLHVYDRGVADTQRLWQEYWQAR